MNFSPKLHRFGGFHDNLFNRSTPNDYIEKSLKLVNCNEKNNNYKIEMNLDQN
jgi:hypothetical protein